MECPAGTWCFICAPRAALLRALALIFCACLIGALVGSLL